MKFSNRWTWTEFILELKQLAVGVDMLTFERGVARRLLIIGKRGIPNQTTVSQRRQLWDAVLYSEFDWNSGQIHQS